VFGLIARSGYKKVDLWGGPPHYQSNARDCDIPALKEKAASYGLVIANLGTYGGRTFESAGYHQAMATLKEDVDNAVTLGSRSIRVSPGHGEDPKLADEMIPFFQEAAAYAASKDIYLGAENHAGSIACYPDLIMRLVSAVDSAHFGVLYDPANLMHCQVDYKEAYKAFQGRIVHAHIKDSVWRDGEYHRTMIGVGDLDMEWIVSHLEEDGYTGDYALEFELHHEVFVNDALPQWLQYFRGVGT